MRRSSRGFTLMEILIAVSIVGLMGAVTAGAFQTSVRARDMVEQDNVLYRQVRIALSRMSRELGSAFVSDRYDPKRYRDQNDRPTNFIGEAERITFTTFAHQRMLTDSKETDQAIVEYRVESSRDPARRGKQDLIRRQKALIQDRMDRDGSEDVLFEDLRKLELAYWDSQKKEWVDEWDTRRMEQKDLLPTRVRITILANDENGEERRYTTQTRVMLNTTLPRY